MVVVVWIVREGDEADGARRVGRCAEAWHRVAILAGHRVPRQLVAAHHGPAPLHELLRRQLRALAAREVQTAHAIARDDRWRRRGERTRHRDSARAVGRVLRRGRALHLQRDAAEVHDDLLEHVALAVGLERLKERLVVGVVERLGILKVDVEDIDVRLCVREAGLLVKAKLKNLDPVHELALVRRDLATTAHLVRLVVHRAELDALDGLVHTHVDHVQLEGLGAAIGDERTRHNLVVLEVAWEVPVVALERLLADDHAEAVHATMRHNVCYSVDHEHLARTQLVLDVCGRRADYLCPSAGLVAELAQALHVGVRE